MLICWAPLASGRRSRRRAAVPRRVKCPRVPGGRHDYHPLPLMLSWQSGGPHATSGLHPGGSGKGAGMWVSALGARRMSAGCLLTLLAWVGLEVTLFLLAALFLD